VCLTLTRWRRRDAVWLSFLQWCSTRIVTRFVIATRVGWSWIRWPRTSAMLRIQYWSSVEIETFKDRSRTSEETLDTLQLANPLQNKVRFPVELIWFEWYKCLLARKLEQMQLTKLA